jgi:fumarate reductase flavoprotein subunit
LYNGEAKGYRSTVKVQVRISARKILSVKVIEHNEARPRTAIMEMPRRIALARDTKGVDVVTGATVTSNAILAAVEAAVEYAKTK